MHPFYAIKIFEKGKHLDNKKYKIINLSLGEPMERLPKKIINAAVTHIKKNHIGYTESIGILKLRKLVSKHYRKFYGIHVPYEKIAITSGASASILLTLLSCFDPGDIVAISRPGYPCYKNIIKALNLKPFFIDLKYEENYKFTVNNLKRLPVETKGIIISSPSNPLGTIIEDTQLREICDYCVKKNITLISDEIYHGIKYDKNLHKSALNFTSKAIVINSFSKYFLMTGWRLGWIIIDEKYMDTISRLAMNLYLSPPNLSQYTAIELFNHYKYFNQIIDGYKVNRQFIIENLKNSGLTDFIIPQGAFYIYLNVSSIARDSYKFCKKMVEDISVTAAPGIDFDEKKGNQFIRLSYATKFKDLEQALKRIKGWI